MDFLSLFLLLLVIHSEKAGRVVLATNDDSSLRARGAGPPNLIWAVLCQ